MFATVLPNTIPEMKTDVSNGPRQKENQKQSTPMQQNQVNMECAANWRILPGVSDGIFRTGTLLYCPQLPSRCHNVHTSGKTPLLSLFTLCGVLTWKRKKKGKETTTLYTLHARH
jgi:hypothetical protein